MNEIYSVKVHGKVLESRDLKKLLARAVQEKRTMDFRFRMLVQAGSAPAAAAAGSSICIGVLAGMD